MMGYLIGFFRECGLPRQQMFALISCPPMDTFAGVLLILFKYL